MDKIKKVFAWIAGLGVVALALYLAVFLFVILLIVGILFAIYMRFKMPGLRKEFERQQAERAAQGGGTIDAEYVVVEEEPLDAPREPRP